MNHGPAHAAEKRVPGADAEDGSTSVPSGSATNILPVPEWLKPHETLRDSCSRYNGQPVGTYWKAY
jgi:hypothetical protein